jgi:hypothetical protein
MEAFLAEQPQTAPLTRFRDESGILQSSAQERIAKALSEELRVRLTVVSIAQICFSLHNFAFSHLLSSHQNILVTYHFGIQPLVMETS